MQQFAGVLTAAFAVVDILVHPGSAKKIDPGVLTGSETGPGALQDALCLEVEDFGVGVDPLMDAPRL